LDFATHHQGGPAYLSAERRRHRIEALTEKVVLPVGAGYEHFQYTGRADDEDLPLYLWVYSTRIAE
jgi:uncharacterized protein DUF5988